MYGETEGTAVCDVCGREFSLSPDMRYTARNDTQVGIAATIAATNEPSWYDAVDCPMCGCQVVLQLRKRRVSPAEIREVEERGVEDAE